MILFERKLVTMAKAAKIADLTLDAFMDLVAQTGVTTVDYPSKELDREMEVSLDAAHRRGSGVWRG